MATYLITGGAGFVGSHLSERLAAEGHELRVIDDLSSGRESNLGPYRAVFRADILDRSALARAADGVDGIFHLAAVASTQAYLDGWTEAARINLLGGAAVFETAAKAGIPVVYASSAAVYGAAGDRPIAEDTPTRPLSGYGADKLGLELHARTMGGMMGLSSVGLRFFNIFGPRQMRGSPYSGVLTIFLDRWMEGAPLTVFGDGLQTRDFIHVSDAAAALCRAMDHARAGNSGVFNVCSGTATTVLDLAGALSRAVGERLEIRHDAPRPGDIRASLGNPALAERELGFRTAVGLDRGVSDLVRWARETAPQGTDTEPTQRLRQV
ncbi:NAD-dependent epimerase/dehydratase family protein [Rhodobacterales bacterium HKCCE2091]|nr:NAD-dependent epimerase/dehydratase family protein [Rhodobacterales bacterium HKCCE2091]